MSYGEPVRCAAPNCGAKHPGGKWGNIRAHSDGWYESKDGKSYCPEHIPKWVRKWRQK